jgi:hypothetical protein
MSAELSLAVTQVMKGVVYRDTHEKAWRHLLDLQAQVRDHVCRPLATYVFEALDCVIRLTRLLEPAGRSAA